MCASGYSRTENLMCDLHGLQEFHLQDEEFFTLYWYVETGIFFPVEFNI